MIFQDFRVYLNTQMSSSKISHTLYLQGELWGQSAE